MRTRRCSMGYGEGGRRSLAVLNRAALTLIVLLGCLPRTALGDKPPGLSPQTLTLPNGPTSLKGLGDAFSANPATGTGSFSIPIDVPPGFLKPDMSVQYAAGKGKGGVLGISFSLPILNIYRSRDKGGPKYAESDRFAVSGPGVNDDLVVVDFQRGHYRLKNESLFARFVRDRVNNSWKIEFPNGKKAYLGETADGRQAGLWGATYKWFVERVTDPFGHSTTYEYFKHYGRVYLQQVNYQEHTFAAYQDRFINRVVLSYEERPDVFADYSYGARIVTYKRLSNIDVQHGGTIVRSYAFGYETEALYSVLKRVEFYGRNGFSDMPPLTFEYLKHERARDPAVWVVHSANLKDIADGVATLEDVNADGLPDILVGQRGNYHYYENINGHSFSGEAIALGNSPDQALHEEYTVLVDIDGDGFRDVFHRWAQGDYCYHRGGNIVRGTFLGYGDCALLRGNGVGSNYGAVDTKMVDLNGDGRIDILRHIPAFENDMIVMNLASNDLVERFIGNIPLDSQYTLYDPRVSLLDLNGDSQLDIVFKEIGYGGSTVRAWYGAGEGRFWWSETVFSNVPRGADHSFHWADVNNDGQTDLVEHEGRDVRYYLNVGGAFTEAVATYGALVPTWETRVLRFADMNGNGTRDIVWMTYDDRLLYVDLMAQEYAGLLSRIDNGMGKVTEISYRSSTEYLIEAKRRGEPWVHPMPTVMPLIAEVRITDSMDKVGIAATESVITYDYRDGYYDGKEREFRGFEKTVTTEWSGDVFQDSLITETYTHVGRNAATGADEESLKGKPFLQIMKDSEGRVLKTVQTKWEQRWLCQEDAVVSSCTWDYTWSCSPESEAFTEQVLPGCMHYGYPTPYKDRLVGLAVATQTLQGAWEGTGLPRYSASRSAYDAWGNDVRTEKLGEVLLGGSYTPGMAFDLNGDNVTAGVGDDEVIETKSFANNVAQWLLRYPVEQQTLGLGNDGTERPIVSSRTYYDDLPLGQVSLGLATEQLSWTNVPVGCEAPSDEAECWVTAKAVEYNNDGMAARTSDANGNVTELEYDETGWFQTVERSWVESGAVEYSAAYDRGLGQISEATDYNGYTTQFDYDDMGRLAMVIDHYGSASEPLVRYTYAPGSSEYPISVTTIDELTERGGAYRTSYVYSDGLGRERLKKEEAEAAYGYIASGWSRLTSRGEVAEQVEPFPSNNAGFEPAADEIPRATTYYDALGRPTRKYLPATAEHGESYSELQYLPFEVHSYDERDTGDRDAGREPYPAVTCLDGAERTRFIKKFNYDGANQSTLLWGFDYDAAGQLVRWRDPRWHTLTTSIQTPPAQMSCRELAQALPLPQDEILEARHARLYHYDSLGHLRSVTDPSLGHVTYDYDAVGNRTRRTDVLGQELVWTYGFANRVHRLDVTNDADGDPDYHYAYHYDVADLDGPLPAAENLIGRLAWVEFPTGTAHYSYDYQGRGTDEVARLWDPATASFEEQHQDPAKRATFSRDTDYDVQGKAIAATLPGGLKLDFAYNERRLLQGVSGGFEISDSVVEQIEYDHRGAVLSSTTRNSVSTCRRYNSRGEVVGVLSGLGVDCDQTGSSATQRVGFQHLVYHRDALGMIASIEDLSVERPTVPRLSAAYTYDRLQQLLTVTAATGNYSFSYDEIQNLTSRQTNALSDLPTGTFTYGEGTAGPNMLTGAGGTQYEYDAVGNLKNYQGYELSFNPEGQLTRAKKQDGATTNFYYDIFGERRITVTTENGKRRRMHRAVFDTYQIRDGEDIWTVDAGASVVEVSSAPGILVDLELLNQLNDYLSDPEATEKPLPEEYMDLDGDGDYFDPDDFAVAETAVLDPWERHVGGARRLWRYIHREHLSSTTHTTDSSGTLVGFQGFRPYGSRFERLGLQPTRGFSGAEHEADSELKLIRFGRRYYSPALGRWVSGDRYIGESPDMVVEKILEAGLYSYAQNNPANFVDPTGLSAWVNNKGRVISMLDDGDTSVYRTWKGENQTRVERIGDLRPKSETLSTTRGSRGRQESLDEAIHTLRQAGGAQYHNRESTEALVRSATLDHQEGGLLSAVSGHAAGGRYDFKVQNSADLFHTDSGVLEADQFGNYITGYSTNVAFGLLGELGTRAAGHAFALGEHGTLDDAGSVEMIDLGIQQSSGYDPMDNACR